MFNIILVSIPVAFLILIHIWIDVKDKLDYERITLKKVSLLEEEIKRIQEDIDTLYKEVLPHYSKLPKQPITLEDENAEADILGTLSVREIPTIIG